MFGKQPTSVRGLVDPDDWQVRIGRQGIYDRHAALVAHELLFGGLYVAPADGVNGAPRDAESSSADRAISQMISTTFGDFGLSKLSAGLPLYLNVTRAFLVGELPLPFGAEGIVLEILDDVVADEEVVAGIERLRSRGFRFALDDFVGEPARLSLLGLVDAVKIDLLDLPGSLEDVLDLCRRYAPRARLMAKNIEYDDMLDACLNAGFELFQGYQFQRPVLLEKARMSPTQGICLRLLRTLEDPAASIEEIEDIVAADPGLSLIVLRGANSASAAPQSKVTSLRQAIVLLGPPILKAWVTLTLLGGGLTPGSRMHLMTVLARAECCASVARSLGRDPQLASTAYLAGLLSGIAEVMRADVGELATDAGIDDDLVNALTIGTGTVGEIVRMVVDHEIRRPFTPTRLEISEADLARAYLSSWNQAVAHVGRVHDS